MRSPLFKIVKRSSMLDDAPWTWGGHWCDGMPSFFQGMPGGVYDNIYDDLDDSPVSYHITEVREGGGGRGRIRRANAACTNSLSTPPSTRTSGSEMSSTSTKTLHIVEIQSWVRVDRGLVSSMLKTCALFYRDYSHASHSSFSSSFSFSCRRRDSSFCRLAMLRLPVKIS